MGVVDTAVNAAAPAAAANSLGWLGGPWGMALSLALPSILGLLGGRGEDLVSMRRRAQAMLDPNSINVERNTQLANLINSPATAAARAQMVQGGQAAIDGLNARLGQTGLGRSGVGLAMEGAIRAAPDVQMGRMLGSYANEAMDRALQIQQARANAIMQGGAVNSMTRDMFGATVSSFLPYLLRTNSPTTTQTPNPKAPLPGETKAQTQARGRILDYNAQNAATTAPTYGGTSMPIGNPNEIAAAHGVTPGVGYQGFKQPYNAYAPKPWTPPSWKGYSPDQSVFANNEDYMYNNITMNSLRKRFGKQPYHSFDVTPLLPPYMNAYLPNNPPPFSWRPQ